MASLYYVSLLFVVGVHILFAYRQWFQWPKVCEALTDLEGAEVAKTASLGRSFASYNGSIAVGLLMSLSLEPNSQTWVQGVTLGFIVLTAAVGASGTKGNTILLFRLLPAAIALLLLMLGL